MNKHSLALAASVLGCVFSVATSEWEPSLFAASGDHTITLAAGGAPVAVPLRATVRATARFDGVSALNLGASVTQVDVGDEQPAADPQPDAGQAAPAPQIEGALSIELLRAGADEVLADATIDLATATEPTELRASLFAECGVPCEAQEDFVVRLSLHGDAPTTTVTLAAFADLRYLLGEDEEVPANDSFTLTLGDDEEPAADAGPVDADAGSDEPAADAGAEEPAVDAGA